MLISFSSLWTNFFPPKPAFTEQDVGNLDGKVHHFIPLNRDVEKVRLIIYTIGLHRLW
jgi:hypothetical protein